MSVQLTINSCKDCPNLRTERYYTADSWEYVLTWYCGKTDRPQPEMTDKAPKVPDSSRIGWEEGASEPTTIPEWCPLRENS